MAAGDQLVRRCPTWSWAGGDPARRRPYLPADKQFLVTRGVPCRSRVAALGNSTYTEALAGEGGEDGVGDDWIATHVTDGASGTGGTGSSNSSGGGGGGAADDDELEVIGGGDDDDDDDDDGGGGGGDSSVAAAAADVAALKVSSDGGGGGGGGAAVAAVAAAAAAAAAAEDDLADLEEEDVVAGDRLPLPHPAGEEEEGAGGVAAGRWAARTLRTCWTERAATGTSSARAPTTCRSPTTSITRRRACGSLATTK